MVSRYTERLQKLVGWILPGVAGLSSIWSPTVGATVLDSGPSAEGGRHQPITFASTLNQDVDNMYAAHRSHSSHSSHRSHSSHYSSSGGGYVSPSRSSPTYTAPPVTAPSSGAPTGATGTANPAKPRINAADPALKNLVMRVQLALYQKGFDPGAVDGTLGSPTRHALRQFQTVNGLDVTGTMTTETLNALGVKMP